MTRLGHVQRGGIPTVFDRMLGARLAAEAIEQLSQGGDGVLVGLVGNRETTTPLAEVTSRDKSLDLSLLKMANILAE